MYTMLTSPPTAHAPMVAPPRHTRDNVLGSSQFPPFPVIEGKPDGS